MSNSNPASATPGIPLPESMAGNFQDAARWFNQMWAGAVDATSKPAGGPIPSMMMPTLDPKELEKRIADLRSVEHWLNMNLGLLRTTIQTLEMQRTALTAWQSMGASAAEAMGSAAAAAPGAAPPPAGSSGTPPGAAQAAAFQPAAWWGALQQQFAQMAANAVEAGAKPAATSSETPESSARPGQPAPRAKPPGVTPRG